MLYTDVYANVSEDTFPFPILYTRFFLVSLHRPGPACWTEVLRVGFLASFSLRGKASSFTVKSSPPEFQ